jgi:aminoglycoside 6'-N-acetyltransferase
MTTDAKIKSVNPSAYAFRPAVRADLPMLRRWLRTPEVLRWWGDAEEQEALLREDFAEPAMVMRVVSFDGRPFAYAQDYEVHAWPQTHFAHLPQGARAIDSFIGVPDMIGCGHGATFLRLLAERLLTQGTPMVAIDPDRNNIRARRAYARAGFREGTVVDAEAGPTILMLFEG